MRSRCNNAASHSHTQRAVHKQTDTDTHTRSENIDTAANAMEGHGSSGNVYIHTPTNIHWQAFIQTNFHTLK